MKIVQITYENRSLLMDKDFQDVLSRLAPCKVSLDDIDLITRIRLTRGIETLIAIIDEKIVGTVSYFIEHKFIHNGGKVGHLEDLVVDSDYKGMDIGGELTNSVIEECKKANCYKVILDCNDALEPYYNKLGFYRKGFCMRFDIFEPEG